MIRKSLLISIGGFIGIIVLLNLFVSEPHFESLEEKIDFEILTKHYYSAENSLYLLTNQDPTNVSYHYKYINLYVNNTPFEENFGKERYTDILKIYDQYTESTDEQIVDIGYYGKGLIHAHFFNYKDALMEFEKVENRKLPYLNNSIGYVYMANEDYETAEQYLKYEIENGGNIEGAYYNLSLVYVNEEEGTKGLIDLISTKEDARGLKELLSTKEGKKYASTRVQKTYYFTHFQPFEYAVVAYRHIFLRINIWGAIAALLITGSWMMYLRKIDVFEPEKWKHIFLTFGLGMLFSFIVEPLSDINNIILGFSLTGGFLNDFLYCVIGIGAVEELAKIIPLFIILKKTKTIDEPYDYILYASMSALGFAFVENLIYFQEDSLEIIHGRALTAVVLHMFLSSIIAYGMILNRYKRHYNGILNFLVFFAIASIVHGFYDFWLINEIAQDFRILSVLVLIFGIVFWNTFKNNALNHSNFYDKDKLLNKQKLEDYLIYSLIGIFLFEYVAMAISYSPSIANSNIIYSVFSGAYLIIFITISLSKFKLFEGFWQPLMFSKKKVRILEIESVVGKDYQIDIVTRNKATQTFLPNSGIAKESITISNEPDWYVIQLNQQFNNEKYLTDKVLIRTKNKKQIVNGNPPQLIALYIIPINVDLEQDKLNRKDLIFCGWAKLSVLN